MRPARLLKFAGLCSGNDRGQDLRRSWGRHHAKCTLQRHLCATSAPRTAR